MMSKGVKARAKDTREAHHRPSTSRQLYRPCKKPWVSPLRRFRKSGAHDRVMTACGPAKRELTGDVSNDDDVLVGRHRVGLVDGLAGARRQLGQDGVSGDTTAC